MDDDQRRLVNHLYAMVTAMLEDATELAVAGQSSRQTAAELTDIGKQLQAQVADILIVVQAAVIIAK